MSAVENTLNTLSFMLTTEGYEVRGVPDEQMALTVIENKPPELILLDVKMPGMDGFEVCRQITAWRPVLGRQHRGCMH